MKAFLFQHLLLVLIFANQQNMGQLLPNNYRDLIYDIRLFSKNSHTNIRLLTSDFNLQAVTQILKYANNKNTYVALFIPLSALNRSVRNLALYKNIKIYILNDYPSDCAKTLILFDDKIVLELSLPLEEIKLTHTQGSFSFSQDSKTIQKTIKRFSILKEESTDYFIN